MLNEVKHLAFDLDWRLLSAQFQILHFVQDDKLRGAWIRPVSKDLQPDADAAKLMGMNEDELLWSRSADD